LCEKSVSSLRNSKKKESAGSDNHNCCPWVLFAADTHTALVLNFIVRGRIDDFFFQTKNELPDPNGRRWFICQVFRYPVIGHDILESFARRGGMGLFPNIVHPLLSFVGA